MKILWTWYFCFICYLYFHMLTKQNTLLPSHLRPQRGTARGSSSHCHCVSAMSACHHLPTVRRCLVWCIKMSDVRTSQGCPMYSLITANNSVHSWSAPGSDCDTRPISARPRPRSEDTTGPRPPFPVCILGACIPHGLAWWRCFEEKVSIISFQIAIPTHAANSNTLILC